MPRSKFLRSAALTAALSVFAIAHNPAEVQAEEFRIDRFFVVGDSLSDAGSLSQAARNGILGAVPPGTPVPDIRYRFLTNAPDGSSQVWTEVLADQLGLESGPDVIHGSLGAPTQEINGGNYAEGGSRVAGQPGIAQNIPFGVPTTPVTEQVDNLLADSPSFYERDLIALWAGSNDVFFEFGGTLPVLGQAAAEANMVTAAQQLVEQVDRLKAAGAQNIIVVTIPDIGTTPFGIAQEAANMGSAGVLTSLGDAFNNELRTALPGRDVVIVDAGKLLNAVIADPVRYGFTAPNAATQFSCPTPPGSLFCVQGLNAAADSEGRIFADDVHPTTAAHAIFGQAGFAGLQAASQAGTIPVATLSAIRQQAVSLENRLNPTAFATHDKEQGTSVRRVAGAWEVYGGLEGGYYSSDAEQVRPGLEAYTQVVRAGADVMVTDNALVGLAGSVDHGQLKFDGDRGGFDSRLFLGAAFGMLELPKGIYLNAAAGLGSIHVLEVERSFDLGPSRESYTAETDGYYAMVRVGGGVVIPVTQNRTVLFNPAISFTHEEVSINGYTESDGAASLSFGDLEYSSQRLSISATGTFRSPEPRGFVATLRASLEHDINEDDLEVPMGPDSDTLATVRAPRPDGTFGYLQAQIAKPIGPGVFSLAGSTIVAADGLTGITGSLSYRAGF